MEDEGFEVDEFAGEPQAGAGVVKMRAGVKTVAQGAGAQALVEAGEGVLGGDDSRHEADVEGRQRRSRPGRIRAVVSVLLKDFN